MEPIDKGNVAYFIFFWLGAGFLFPWNAFITAVDYFSGLYPTAHVDFLFAISYMTANLATLLLLMRFGRHYTSKSRVSLGFTLFLVLILLIPVIDLVTVRGGKGNVLSLALTVGAVFSSGIIDGVVQGSLFGIAGELPERYTQALVGGTSASGVIISVVRMLTKALLPNTPKGLRVSADIYFGVSSFFVALCLLGFHTLYTLPIIKFYDARKLMHVRRLLLSDDSEDSENVCQVPVDSWEQRQAEADWEEDEKVKEAAALLTSSEAESIQSDYFTVFQKIWVYPCTLCCLYVVTLSIFPGFISEGLHSEALGDWYAVLLFASFNLCDFMGKMTPTVWVVHNTSALVGGACSRVLLYPLFSLCIFGPTVFGSEVVVFILTMVLGFTNGVFTSWLMMHAPSKVGLENSEAAGFIMVLFLILGLFLGSVGGWAWMIVL